MTLCRWLPLGLAPAAAGLLAGCAADSRPPSDPLLGGGLPTPPAAATAAPGAVRPATAAVPPPLPVPSAPGSNALLAAGGGRATLDPTRELKIAANANGPRDGGVPGRGQATPVLHDPQPLTADPGRTPPGPAPGVRLTGATAATSYEQLKAELRDRGLIWMSLNSSLEGGRVKFACYVVPDRNHPDVRRYYEKEDADELSAMRAVLDAINAGL
jgi:hypothetical protein